MPESSSLTQNWENADKRETKKIPRLILVAGFFLVMSYLLMKGLYPQGKAQANNL